MVDFCIAQQIRYTDLSKESPAIRNAIQKKYASSINIVRHIFFQEYTRKENIKIRKNIVKIKNILFPFYSLHQSEIGRYVLFNKLDDLSVFLSDPENYDYVTYMRKYYKKRLLER